MTLPEYMANTGAVQPITSRHPGPFGVLEIAGTVRPIIDHWWPGVLLDQRGHWWCITRGDVVLAGGWELGAESEVDEPIEAARRMVAS